MWPGSFRPSADNGERAVDPGASEVGRSGDPDNAHAGAVQLLDDRRRQRFVTADDDVAAHVLVHFAGKQIATESSNTLHGAKRAFLRRRRPSRPVDQCFYFIRHTHVFHPAYTRHFCGHWRPLLSMTIGHFARSCHQRSMSFAYAIINADAERLTAMSRKESRVLPSLQGVDAHLMEAASVLRRNNFDSSS
jgi:hypothetical protein